MTRKHSFDAYDNFRKYLIPFVYSTLFDLSKSSNALFCLRLYPVASQNIKIKISINVRSHFVKHIPYGCSCGGGKAVKTAPLLFR